VNEQLRISPVAGHQCRRGPAGRDADGRRWRRPEAGRALVEGAPNERPPVCKIMDLRQVQVLPKKRASQQSTKTRSSVNETEVRPKTGDTTYEVKVKRGRESSSTRTRSSSMSSPRRGWRHIDEGARS